MKFILPVLFCVLIVSSTYGYSIVIDIEFQLEALEATWADFKTRHVVATNQGNALAWNNLLRTRIKSQYGTKVINTFVVNAETVIETNFPSSVPDYKGGSSSNLFWSSTTQRIFVMKLSGTPRAPFYNVFDCGQMWYVAGLNMATRQPVHYQGHARNQGPKLGPITDRLCKQVN